MFIYVADKRHFVLSNLFALVQAVLILIKCSGAVCRRHGLINYKDTKTKCRYLKKLTFKGCSLEFIDW